MVLHIFLLARVCVVWFFVCFGLGTGETETVGVQTEDFPGLDGAEAATDLICQTCNCTEPGVVDCAAKGIANFFEIQDWDGLKPFNPITVDLSQNQFTSVSRISSLPIQHLNLSHCEIAAMEDGTFVYLADLVTIDLSHNKITTSAISRRVFGGVLTPSIGLLPYAKLRHLSLADNDLHSLPADVFTWMPGMTRFDLSGNQLAFIDQVTMAAISDLVNLRELNLDRCELEYLPDGLFRRLRRLTKLDLSDNRFTIVPAVLGEATNLQYLNFGKNPIEVLATENPIRNLSKLQELRLARNSKLQTIEANALGGLPNLVSLHINYNARLSTIHSDFLLYTDEHDAEAWPVLTEFYLNNNNLSRLDSGYIHRWDQLVRADFSNNPYVCDCTNQWVVDVLIPLLIKLDNQSKDTMICMKPAELRSVSLAQLHAANKSLTCTELETFMEMPVPNMAILLGIMIGIFVTFPIVLILVLLWRKGYFARCRNVKEDYDDEETDAF